MTSEKIDRADEAAQAASWAASCVTKPADRHGVAGGDAGLREAALKRAQELRATIGQPNNDLSYSNNDMYRFAAQMLEAVASECAALTPPAPPSPRVSGDREALAREEVRAEKLLDEALMWKSMYLTTAKDRDDLLEKAALASSPPAEMAGVEGTKTLESVLKSFRQYNDALRAGWSSRPAVKINDRLIAKAENELAAIRPRQDTRAAGAVERVRHVKSGTEYEVIGEAETQVSKDGLLTRWDCGVERRIIQNGCLLTVYRGSDGKLWCRFTDEFRDGRFVPTTPTGTDDGEASI